MRNRWIAVANRFHRGSKKHPDLEHVRFEFPLSAAEAAESSRGDPPSAGAAPSSRQARPAEALDELRGLIRPFAGCVMRHDQGREDIFYGDPDGANPLSLDQFAELAREALDIAIDSGLQDAAAPPESRGGHAEIAYTAAYWMDVVLSLAGRAGPGSPLRLTPMRKWSYTEREWDGSRRLENFPLPDGLVCLCVPGGVFRASAVAAKLLSGQVPSAGAEAPSAAEFALDGLTPGSLHPVGTPAHDLGRPSNRPRCAVELFGRGRPPRVWGKVVELLTTARYDVVQALVDAFPNRLSGCDLVATSRHDDAVKVLRAVRKLSPPWESAILLPGRTGRGLGYGLADAAEGLPRPNSPQ